MGKILIEFNECDVCGKKTKDKFLPEDWITYRFSKSWRSGSHAGEYDKSFLACSDCVDTKSVFKKMLNYLKGAKHDT